MKENEKLSLKLFINTKFINTKFIIPTGREMEIFTGEEGITGVLGLS